MNFSAGLGMAWVSRYDVAQTTSQAISRGETVIKIRMQRPRGGCENCGGEVRTRKPGFGWTCAKCVRVLSTR